MTPLTNAHQGKVINCRSHNIKNIISMKKNNKRAFTLLEMLVVIGIIAVLIGVGTVSYSTAQRKARDARRKSDLRAIRDSLEQYYSLCGYTYPLPVSDSVPASIVCASPNTTLMSDVPVDPKTAVSYSMTGDGTIYSICAPNTPPLETADDVDYCLSNQQ